MQSQNNTLKCAAEGCDKPRNARNRNRYCAMHIGRLARHGDLNAGWPTLHERFWRQVNKNGPVPPRAPHLGPCWLWTGSLFVKSGRPCFSPMGKRRLAYRWAYEDAIGPIPEGLTIDHLCFVPLCVRPDHLEPVTDAENIRRSSAHDFWRNKTHCPAGHPYDEANTYIDGRGHRHCRACMYARHQMAP